MRWISTGPSLLAQSSGLVLALSVVGACGGSGNAVSSGDANTDGPSTDAATPT
ncbi:MAG: hypothetical protein JKY37_16355, partial [Nannocystaceae bacterium]|nr:hypothetical protein [Nannocystaceae bacterium]